MNIELYDNNHGPWVQAMLLGLYERGIEHQLRSVPPLESLMKVQRLVNMRRWIACMHERFSDYPYLHSGSYFEPRRPQPESASLAQRLVFYLGLMTMILALPITLPLVFLLRRRVPS